MRDTIKSFILLIIIIVIFGTLIIAMLDVFGVITLPKEISVRDLLSSKTTQTVALVESNIITYPKEYYIKDNNNNENSTEVDYNNLTTIPVEVGNTTASQVQTNTLYGANNHYYYNQLNTYGKTIYNELYKNLDNLKTGTYVVEFGEVFDNLLNTEGGEQTLTDAFQLSINAMLLDHPEIFYLDVTKMFMYTEISQTILKTTYKISIGPEEGTSYLFEGFNSKSDVLIAEDEINTILYALTNSFEGNTYEKVKQAHNYLVDNLVYDEYDININSHNIYGALMNKKAVCDGYAKAYKLILDYMGIHCVQVCGTATNSAGESESHTWNYVLLNDLWYAVDTTWDDPIIIGGGTLTTELKYKNFLCGSDVFFQNHREDGYIIPNGKFAYPVLSNNNY